MQLAMLLEQLLAPSQHEANVRTKKGSNDPVEFAIKLPGRDTESEHVYLPIDAKFPKDTYELLLNAYENGSPDEIETASKNLEATVKKMAKDICEKYIDPPNTTDFTPVMRAIAAADSCSWPVSPVTAATSAVQTGHTPMSRPAATPANATWPFFATFKGIGTTERKAVLLDQRMIRGERVLGASRKDFIALFAPGLLKPGVLG